MTAESFCRPVNCSYLAGGRLESENDVSGIGITISFIGSAGLAVLLLAVYYLFVFDPLQDPSQLEGSWTDIDEESISQCQTKLSSTAWQPNPIDVEFLKWVRGTCWVCCKLIPGSRRLFKGAKRLDLGKVFYKSIINVSDIQILAGVGALASAYISLGCGKHPISAYHWHMVTNQAWLSSVTHLAGLTIIRGYLRNEPWKRNTRLTFIGLVFVALLIALVPTSFFEWFATFRDKTILANPAAPAACYFKATYGTWNVNTTEMMILNGDYSPEGEVKIDNGRTSYRPWTRKDYVRLEDSAPFQDMVFVMILLVFGAGIRCFKMISPVSGSAASRARRRVSTLLQKTIIWISSPCLEERERDHGACKSAFSRIWFHALVRPSLATFLALRLYCDLFCSLLAEVYCLILAVTLGVFRILAAQTDLDVQGIWVDTLVEEKQWAYGQILPLLLLVSPLISFASTLVTEMRKQSSINPVDLRMRTFTPPVPDLSEIREGSSDSDARRGFRLRPGGSDQVELETRPKWLGRDYYETALWLRPCLISFFCGICLLTSMVTQEIYGDGDNLLFAQKIFHSKGGMVSLWLTSPGFLSAIGLAFPCSCIASLALALMLDPWFQNRRKVIGKRLLTWLLATTLFFLYQTFSYMMFPELLPVGMIQAQSCRYLLVTAALYIFYVVSYLVFLLVVWLGKITLKPWRSTHFQQE